MSRGALTNPPQMFVGGRWTGALSGATETAFSPVTGAAIGDVPQGDREDVQRRSPPRTSQPRPGGGSARSSVQRR